MYRLSRVAVEFRGEMCDALTRPKSGPAKDAFEWNRVLLKLTRGRGFSIQYLFRPGHIMAVHDCLKRCLQELHVLPQAAKMLRRLLFRAAASGLIPRSIESPFPFPLCAFRRGPDNALRTSPHTGLPAGKAAEGPILSGKGGASDSSGLGLSDLAEH